MKTFKIIATNKTFNTEYELFEWLSNYTGIVSASNNYCTLNSVKHGIILETSMYNEKELDELLYPHEAIELTD